MHQFSVRHQRVEIASLRPAASPALGHELGPNGAARDGGQVAMTRECFVLSLRGA